MKRVYIYCPKSGSRIISLQGIPAVKYQNESVHVWADAQVVAKSSSPRRHWREDGRCRLATMVKELGGVAWDQQGVLCYAGSRPNTAVVAANLSLLAMEASDSKAADLLRWKVACLTDRLTVSLSEILQIASGLERSPHQRPPNVSLSSTEEGDKRIVSLTWGDDTFYVSVPAAWEPELA